MRQSGNGRHEVGTKRRLGFLALAFVCAPAVAQESLGSVEQVRIGSDPTAPIEQVSTGTREVMTSPVPRAPAQPVQQLSVAGGGARPPAQLSGDEPGAAPPTQLYRGGPTAQPPQALSDRSQGRTAAVTPVEGEDACDPADEEQARSNVCEHVIETRSAEFVRPDPTLLSPEQRLIVEQRLRESPIESTRRLAKEGDADSLEALGVASIVLNQPQAPPERRPKDPAQDPALDAAAEAVLAIIGQGASVTPPE